MQYILIVMSILILGCSDEGSNNTVDTISNTQELQPSTQDTQIQPPKPPAID